MQVFEINAKVIKQHVGVDVDESFVLVAKHEVMGLSAEQISETLSCELSEIHECMADADYKKIKGFVAGVYSESLATQTAGWDALENIALQRVMKYATTSSEPEFLLKAAMIANRAQRKHQQANTILDPSRKDGTATIMLTQRLTNKLRGGKVEETEIVRELSISDGSMINPKFEEIDALLGVRDPNQRQEQTRPEITTYMAESDATVEDIAQFVFSKARR